MEEISLLKMGVVTEIVPFPGALIFKAPARWSKDPLQETRRAGEVFSHSQSGLAQAGCCGAKVAHRKMQNRFFKNSGFASGFFEGKPRGKQTNKNTSQK
jgi:hypothetical protein